MHFSFSVSVLEEETVRKKIRPHVLHKLADCFFLLFPLTVLYEHLYFYEIESFIESLSKMKLFITNQFFPHIKTSQCKSTDCLLYDENITEQKKNLSIKDLFSKCSHLLRKSLIESLIFCPVFNELTALRLSKILLAVYFLRPYTLFYNLWGAILAYKNHVAKVSRRIKLHN